MPNWRKVIVSGSDAILNKLIVDTDISASLFSGSFVGDGSGLTGIGGDPFPYTGSAVISGSLQVTGSIYADSIYVTEFEININFIDTETWVYRAPEDFVINSIDNPDGLTCSIQLNTSSYTTGSSITYLDTLEITPDAPGFIKLNCEII